MKLIRYFAVAVAGLAVASGTASAAGGPGCSTCGHTGFGHGGLGGFGGLGAPPAPSTLFGGSHKKLPAFQAAPWYNYWPYDGHFLTPAPVGGAFYGPPQTGNFPVNPYFPGPAVPYGYGPIPGGPPPGGVGR